MSASQDQVLALLLLQHAKDSCNLPEGAREERVIAYNAHLLPTAEHPKTGQALAKVKRYKNAALPTNHRKLTSLSVVIPPVGTYDAKGFMVAMRQAGKRLNDQGKSYTLATEIRNDEIKAIAGYCGYDSRLSHGSQDASARSKASRELSGRPIAGMLRADQKAMARTLQGFVAGCPDNVLRQIRNLEARERGAAEAMIQHNHDAEDLERSADDRVISMQLAAVEGERLTQIRADLDALQS